MVTDLALEIQYFFVQPWWKRSLLYRLRFMPSHINHVITL